jgi:hypothetical protein
LQFGVELGSPLNNTVNELSDELGIVQHFLVTGNVALQDLTGIQFAVISLAAQFLFVEGLQSDYATEVTIRGHIVKILSSAWATIKRLWLIRAWWCVP